MKFRYFAGEQQTKEWFDLRLGLPTASYLWRWMAVSKKDHITPLKAREDYERELMFERTFNVPFERYTNSAMQEGVDYEAFAREQYEKIKSTSVVKVGCWYNKYFVASPDGGIADEGLVEIKWLKDTNWTEVLATKQPYIGSGGDHWKQIQGQLFASSRKWCDYVTGNLNTKKLIIIRVLPDKAFFKELEASLKIPLSVEPFDKKDVFNFVGVLPEGEPPRTLEEGEDYSKIPDLGF